MNDVPENRAALSVAASRHDRARLTAWLDQFSTPEETYAALRALAEALDEVKTGPERDLADWATKQIMQALCPQEVLALAY